MIDFLEIFEIILLGLISLFAIATVITLMVYPIAYISCSASARALDMKNHSFGMLQGCIYTLPSGQKIDSEHYIVNSQNKEDK